MSLCHVHTLGSHLPLQHNSPIRVWTERSRPSHQRCQELVLCTFQCRLVSNLRIEVVTVECKADRELRISTVRASSKAFRATCLPSDPLCRCPTSRSAHISTRGDNSRLTLAPGVAKRAAETNPPAAVSTTQIVSFLSFSNFATSTAIADNLGCITCPAIAPKIRRFVDLSHT